MVVRRWVLERVLWGAVAFGVVASVGAATASAEPAAAGKGQKAGKGGKATPEMKWAREWVHTRMQLGEHALREGKFQEALDHFEAVIAFEAKLPAELLKPPQGGPPEGFEGPPEGFDGEDGEELGGPGLHKRGHHGGKGGGFGHKVGMLRIKARMGAATALHRMGKEDEAEVMAEDGLRIAKEQGLRRGVKMCERFLEEPDEVITRAAPTAQELRDALKRLESNKP